MARTVDASVPVVVVQEIPDALNPAVLVVAELNPAVLVAAARSTPPCWS